MWHDIDVEDMEDMKSQLRVDRSAARKQRGSKKLVALSADLRRHAEPLLAGRTTIAAFIPYDSEPNLLPLLDELVERGVRVLVPKLGPGLSRDWVPYRGADDLAVRAPRRPPEPSGTSFPSRALGAAQAVLVPALAVDRHGVRLGRGAGWYDRALGHVLPDVPVAATIFDEEFLEDTELPREEHDVPVTHVVTPTRLVAIERNHA